MTAFLKMHGLGNDFAVFDARSHPLAFAPEAARAIADRRFGVGCDQLIVIEKSANGTDAFMRIRNADGGEVEACGNAARCVARLLMDERGTQSVRIDTIGGALVCDDAGAGSVTVDMGEPKFGWQDIPLSEPKTAERFMLTIDGASYDVTALSTGNPHCVLFVEDAEKASVAALGSRIEHHPLFPARTNVEFVSLVGPDRLRMRVWERGAGITSACGTGACATAVAAHLRGFTGRNVEVLLDGGPLHIHWRESDNHMLMTGPTTLSFKGEIDLKAFA
ncbi:MAG TPA: diaminopimelate epimerase [Rhizomicrobium sp.]|jgi:diaminopimelate epimerase|nr:diaminopimelate epimerase [Rhizomicrobium sp.]